ncbi:mandelate racemase/muconate lactonizing enzyme family protein [Biostraticola tofi]|uniref:L-alanine-DL-glutamate epimerase-like enolase superfamily enzyme n=1 Tax=Biostraticola tofi TaxID=466109 RepID=A0A4R3YS30_9GAMM|nr:mandelate racemase/muconate lactonizing enzyme family protein [Biostraticola tofi]TCV95172.1 L-alanine-DL-glutamate epimerase-like enolase superfamily enzyme [Biostraticola tofi]
MKVSLYRASLHYPHLQLHTASSGSIGALEELYLQLDDGRFQGLGEVRVNIAYLNGYQAALVQDNVVKALRQLDWHQPPDRLLATLHQAGSTVLPPTRMLIDIALHDLIARRQGVSVAALLGATSLSAVGHSTNQTLFWSPLPQMLSQATDYVERGFTRLKVRLGVASFAEDERRIAALRQRFGHHISLSADANGQWSSAEALSNLRRLGRYELSYLEQPIADSQAAAYPALARLSPVPLMLDESMSNTEDLERILAEEGKLMAHLKLVKMGGIAPTLAAARRLSAAGISFMVGQMNEGAAATAAALQVACAARPAYAELYGADGLADDPVSGLCYHQGLVSCQPTSGLGVAFSPARAELLQEFIQ